MSIKELKKYLYPVFERYRDKVIFAYLFGSTARETSYPAKDIDIAVYLKKGSPELYFDCRLSLFADLCRTLKTNKVDLIILNTTTNLMLMEEIVRKGIILYEINPAEREEFELKILHHAIDFKQHRHVTMGI